MKYKSNEVWGWIILSISSALMAMFLPWMILKIPFYLIFMVSLIISAHSVVRMGNNPPYFGVVTLWEERLWKRNKNGELITVHISEGWNSLPLRGIKYGVIPVKASRLPFDLPPQVLQTPDSVTTEAGISLIFMVDPDYAANFLNLGGTGDPYVAFKDGFQEIVEQALREWAQHDVLGPQTWKELKSSGLDAVTKILEKLCDTELDKDDPEVKKVSNGLGKWHIHEYGVIIIKLALPNMKPFGPVYEKALKKEMEEQERPAEVYEMSTDLKVAKKYMEKVNKNGGKITLEGAYKVIMGNKITREGNQQISISSLTKQIAGAMKGGNPS